MLRRWDENTGNFAYHRGKQRIWIVPRAME